MALHTKPHGPGRHFDRLRVRHLRLLELIAEHGSLTAAADALQTSQPSTTKMLHELEQAFGCTLVNRSVRGGTLSVAGRNALDRLRVALGSMDAAIDALSSKPDRPLLRIGAVPLAGVTLIPQAVELMTQRQVRPRLELHEGDVSTVVAMLCAGKVDCVIGRVGDIQTYGMHQVNILPLQDEGIEVACAPTNPLAKRRRLSLAHLHDAPWIASPRGSYTRQVFDAAFVSLGLVPPIPEMESPSFHTNLTTASCSDLVAFAPRSAIRLYAEKQRVSRLSLAEPFQIDFLAFLTLRDAPELPAVTLLRSTLTEVVGPANRSTPSLKVSQSPTARRRRR